jgi:photosystem II stability/assembly factor-like uncharacterized protein
MPTHERVMVWYRVGGPLVLLLVLLGWLDVFFALLLVVGAPVAGAAAVVAAVQHRREWPLVLPMALFALGCAGFTGFLFLGSGPGAYWALALALLAVGLATWMGWAPVVAPPGGRVDRLVVLGAIALQVASRRARPLAAAAGTVLIVAAIVPLSKGDWGPGGAALMLGFAMLPVTWRWLALATGWAVPGRGRIAAVAVLALAIAAASGLDPRQTRPPASDFIARELPAQSAAVVSWCGVWGSDSTWIAVGSETIRRSTDGGRTWHTAGSGRKGQLCAVGGWASMVLVAGQWGTLLRSTDGGATWSHLGTGSDEDHMHGAWALDSMAIVVGGGRLLRSADGGATWSRGRLPHGMRGYALTHVWGDEAAITVASNNGIFRSTNGGRRWSRVWHPRDHRISSVWGSGSTVIGVGSWGTIIRSTDGGATWARVMGQNPSPPVREPDGTVVYRGSSISFEGVAGQGSTVVAVGADGAMVRSTDGGASWNDVASGTMHNLSAIWGSDSLFVAVGSAGTILVSRDGGTAWAPADSSLAGRPLLRVAASNGALVAVGPYGNVGRSKDGGVTWTVVTGAWTSNHLEGVWAAGSTVIAVGSAGTILRSLDGGETWADVGMEIPTGSLQLSPRPGDLPPRDGPQDEALRGLLGIEARRPRTFLAAAGAGGIALIAGERGTILRSTDGGTTWSLVESATRQRVAAVWTSGDTAAAVGSRGTIVWSVDGGATWAIGPSGTDAHLTAVWGTDAVLVAIGHSGTLLRSTDGGGTWAPVVSGTHADLEGLWGAGDVLVAVGWGGTILRSGDAGASWTRIRGDLWPEGASWGERDRLRRATMGWLSVSGSDSMIVAMGSDGTLLQSTDQGLTWSEPGSVRHASQR